MFGLFDSGLCPIGIDIGNHSMRLLQFRRSEGKLSLQAAGRTELDAAGAQNHAQRVQVALQQSLAGGRFSGKSAVLCLPPSVVHTKSVRLPQMPDSDLQQALQWEAKDRFGFELGEGRIVWFRAGEVRRGTEVKDELLLFAVEGKVLSQYVEAAMAAGLVIKGIDLAPCAAYRSALASNSLAGGEMTALLDLGRSGAQFSIIRNDQLVFYKFIDIGVRKIDEAVAAKLGIPLQEASQMRARFDLSENLDAETAPLNQAIHDAVRPVLEELARELDMCMRYYVVTFRGTRPEIVTLTGKQAESPRFIESLASAIGLRVDVAQVLRGVLDLGEVARPDRSSEWAIAAGLSIYPVTRKQLEAAA